MHHQHSAALKPMCAFCAPFVFHTFHSSINLRKKKEKENPTSTRHCENALIVCMKFTTRAQFTCVS